MVADRCWDGNPAALLEQGGLPNDGTDGGPTDVAEGIGQEVEGAQPPLVRMVSRTRSLLLIFCGKTPPRAPG